VKEEFVLNGQHYYYTNYNNPGQPIRTRLAVYVKFSEMRTNNAWDAVCPPVHSAIQKDDKGNSSSSAKTRLITRRKTTDVRVKVGDASHSAERSQTDYRVVVSGHLYEYGI